MTTRSEAADANRAGWASLGVVPGRESVVRIQVATGARPADDLGVGLYERSAPRVTSNGVVLRERIQVGDRDYRLMEYRTARVTATVRQLSFTGTGPGVVTAGLDGTTTGRLRVRVDREDVSYGDGGGTSTSPTTSDRPTTTVTVTGPAAGTMLVAYYVADR